jgi:hypothetical protein
MDFWGRNAVCPISRTHDPSFEAKRDAGAYMPGGYAPLVRTVVSELSRSAASAADPYESVAALIAAAATRLRYW